MVHTAKHIYSFIFSFLGILNVYKKSDIEVQNVDNIDFMADLGLDQADKSQDKINLSKDYSNVRKDIAKAWDKKEELAY